MRKKNSLKLWMASAILFSLFISCGQDRRERVDGEVLVVEEQGSFLAGGAAVTTPGIYNENDPTNPAGQTLHGDHAYVFYQKPLHARKYPLVFLHGNGESSKTWETTPDGREGFQNIFLRLGFSVYLVDQPRRGKAGRSTVSDSISALPEEAFQFEIFRLGIWPEFFPDVQFPKDPQSLEQFMRQITPNTGAFDKHVVADAMSAVFDRTGEGVLVTHSMGGGPGWLTVIRNPKVRAVVAYEPGSSFIFPKGEVPAPMPTSCPYGALTADSVSLEQFTSLTRIPIIIYYGDNIPKEPTEHWGQDTWRVRLAMARLFAECINRHGGDAKVVHLPEIGIKGNTHFLFSDLNNLEISDLMFDFLHEKGLD